VYQFIREHGGWANWTMIQLELYPCKSERELHLREREIFDILKPTLNSYSPTLNVEKRKETVKQNNKKYEETHTEELKEYRTEYKVTHREEIKKNKAEYRATHIEEIKKNKAEYYEQNKTEIAAKSKVKITCECGCTIRNSDLSRHRKTNNHLNLMAQKS
jgi:rubrerythrin